MNSEDSSPSPLILRLALGGLACAAAYPLTKFLMVHVPIAAFILFLVISGGAAPILKARRTGMPFAIPVHPEGRQNPEYPEGRYFR